MWLASWLVDFPTSDEFYFWFFGKTRGRRVFMATNIRWGVPGTPPSEQGLMRSWAKNQILDQSGFGSVSSELVGGLADLGWFLFLNHSKDECQARFYGYQTPVEGTGTPLNEPWFVEVMGKNQILDFLPMTSSNHGSLSGVPVPPPQAFDSDKNARDTHLSKG